MEIIDSVKQISSEIRSSLLKEGASLVGFADLRPIPSEARQSMDHAISIGVALNPAIIRRVGLNGPTREYSYDKVRANSLANYLCEFGTKLLTDRGYKAVPLLADDHKKVDKQTVSAPFQHKTAATRAGLGWIGKSALLVTEEYGSALRLSTILTDAVLECGTPIEISKCGECQECTNACPAKAINGTLWDIAKSKEDILKGRNHLINLTNCSRYYSKTNEMLGIVAPARVCGICIAACPKTKRYIGEK